MNRSAIPFGVIGAGRIGKIHAANLAHRIHDARVVILCDIDEQECARVAGLLDIRKTTTDYREVQAIAICSSTNSHFGIIMAADAGKQIFCEKPVDLSIANIQIIDEKIRDLVHSGAVGDPHVVKITSRDADGVHSALPLKFFMERYVESFLTELQIFVDCAKKRASRR